MRIRYFIGLGIILLFLWLAALGAVCAAAYLATGQNIEALNTATIPLGLIPTAAFLTWLAKGNYRDFNRAQNLTLALWASTTAVVAAYITSFVPTAFLEATLSVAVAEVVLWLGLVQATRRLYRNKRAQNIADAAGTPLHHPEVQKLSNNTDLATATGIAVFATAEAIVLLKSEFTPLFGTAAIRIIGLLIGIPLGFMWFNLCPNQSEIRDFIAQKRTAKFGERDDVS